MDFSLTREQELLKKVAAQFAENELEPVAAELDKTHVFPVDNFKKMAEVGFTGIGVPREYGGTGGGATEKVIAVSEFARKCMSSAAILSIHLIAPQAIAKYGTKEQKEKYLPRLTKGGELGAFALTEPNAGSDAGSVQTTAIFDPETNEYVLNGGKCFISGGSRASVLVIFALTDPSKGLRGMSALIVENTMPGFSVGKIEEKMGIAGSETAELIFEDVRVPAVNLLGKEGQGFKIA
ncbi:MAG: acyl-CoA dehydrogenase family protein, partial [Firmicutes bacterium]|nr:acyl-CoA dehydrogenase family protein [Bacillota bacterium]